MLKIINEILSASRRANINAGVFLTLPLSLIFVCAMAACGGTKETNNQKTTLEQEAKDALQHRMREQTDEEGKSRHGEEARTMFANDTLCILHTAGCGKKKKKDRLQHIYMHIDGKKYECLTRLDSDSVYRTHEEMNILKDGTIYHDLTYHEAIFQRAAICLMRYGHIVGDKRLRDFHIELPTRTGHWDMHRHRNIEGEEDTTTYISLLGDGFMSKASAHKAKMTADLRVTKNRMGIVLLEYGKEPVRIVGTVQLNVKDGEGVIHEITMEDANDEYVYFTNASLEMMHLILEKEGTIVLHATRELRYNESEVFQFKFDANGYNEARKYLQ